MNSKLLKTIKKIIGSWYFIPLILLLVAVIFFPLKGVAPSPDSSWYLANAMEIHNNFSLKTLLIRRPLFPFLMAGAFHLFGYGVQSGFYVVRLFFVLNILLAYLIGAKLFNKPTGLTFSLLIFTSFVINRWSSFLLVDIILPFFVLLYILLTYLAFERSKYLYFIFGGVTLGIALLTKGIIAVMFVPLPLFLLIFKKYRNVKNIIGIGLMCLLFILVLSPWINQIISGKESLKILIGFLAEFDEIKRTGLVPSVGESGSVWSMILKQMKTFKNFSSNYIGKKFILWPLFFLGIIYSLYQMIFRKKRAETILIISILLFFPVIYVVSKITIRVGQVIILYFLLYLIVANLLVNFSKKIKRKWDLKLKSRAERRRALKSGRYKYKNIYLKIAIIPIISACLLLQIFVGKTEIKGRKTKRREVKNFYELVTKDKIEGTYGFSFWRGGFELSHWANKSVRDTADWIKEHVPSTANILCQWYYHESIKFFTGGKYKIARLQNLSLYPETIDKISIKEIGKPLFIWPAKIGEKISGNHFLGQFENNLLEQINNSRAEYIIITFRRNFLGLYFENNPNFSLVKSFAEGRIQIYKVNNFPVRPRSDFSPKFGIETYRYLTHLYQDAPYKYEKEKQTLKRTLGWSDDEITKFFSFIENGDRKGFWKNYEMFEESKIY